LKFWKLCTTQTKVQVILAVTVLAVSDNAIDDIAVAGAITSHDNGDEEEILHRDFRWENMNNYTGHREVVQL